MIKIQMVLLFLKTNFKMNESSLIFLLLYFSCFKGFESSSMKRDASWNYKFSFTTNVNSQMSIQCDKNSVIWIGWSHYGTRNSAVASSLSQTEQQQQQSANLFIDSDTFADRINFPNEQDCWMNFTEKIAEQCNGGEQCDLSSQPTYIHKCGKISDYLYVSYKCVNEDEMFDICNSQTKVFTRQQLGQGRTNFYIKSSDFPSEYPSSLDCSCAISSTNIQQPLKLEVLWFSLQDNDYLNIFNKNISGWINPTYEMPILTKNSMIRFLTDDSLAYKGFWLKISSRKACRDDWQLVGDNCVKVFSDTLDWRSANQRCQQMNGYLLKLDDVTSDLKLTQYMKSFYPEINSYWIGLRKYVDEYNKERWMWSNNSTVYNDVSWWPWRRTSTGTSSTGTNTNSNSNNQQTISNDKISHSLNNCVIKRKNEDGYFTTSCDSSNKNSFICQTETINPQREEPAINSEIRLQCGTTAEVQQKLLEQEKLANSFDNIGSSSIKNFENNKLKQPSLLVVEQQKTTKKINSNGIGLVASGVGLGVVNNMLIPSLTTFKPQQSTSSQFSDDKDSFNLNNKIFNPTKSASAISSPSSVQAASPQMPSNTSQITKSSASIVSQSSPYGNLKSWSTLNSITAKQADSKLNTAVLAGMISGIGFVIVLINLGVLFICRRNLKKFLKTTKETRSPRDDMIQEYFDAFNTLHNLQNSSSSIKLGRGTTIPVSNLQSFLNENSALSLPQKALTLHTQQMRTNSTTSNGDDSCLMHESAQLFFNPQQQQQQQFVRELAVRQTTSAFKPFIRDENGKTINPNSQQQQLLINANLMDSTAIVLQQQQQQQRVAQQQQQQQQLLIKNNQYDKMNHHQPIQIVQKLKSNVNDSTGQYAHTYESLDTLDLPNRRAIVHLGISSRNYRTLNGTEILINNQNRLLQSPNSSDDTNAALNVNNSNNLNDMSTTLADLNNFNISTSSTSSSSGTSSTQQLIKTCNQQQQQQHHQQQQHQQQLDSFLLNNNNLNKQLNFQLNDAQLVTLPAHLQSQLAQAQLINLNDLKQFNNLMIHSPIGTTNSNNNNNNANVNTNNKLNNFSNKNTNCICAIDHSGISSNNLIINNEKNCICGAGSWSPDSAYYSSIPTLTNYTSYNLQPNSFNSQHQQQQHHQHQQQQQQFVNSSFNSNTNPNHSFKSHLV